MQPIYRSDGQVVAVVHQVHLYNVDGEWIGTLRGAEVYGITGEYLGYLSEDRRLLRVRRPTERTPIVPPPMPARLRDIPGHFPLAPLFKQLPFGLIDVFEEFPEQFTFVSDLRPDME